MKKLTMFTAIALILATQAGQAASSRGAEYCASFEKLARVVMTGRQKGVSMSKMYSKMDGNKVAEQVVELAYSKSRYSTESYRQNSVDNFANDAFLNCLKAVGEKK